MLVNHPSPEMSFLALPQDQFQFHQRRFEALSGTEGLANILFLQIFKLIAYDISL